MEKNQLIQELKYILTRAVFLDISIYLISTFFIGFTFSMVLGLILGTFGMTVNLILLNKSVRNIIRGGGRKAQSKMFSGYIFRLIIIGVIITISMLVNFINAIGVVIPYFYPKLAYAGNVFFRKGEKAE